VEVFLVAAPINWTSCHEKYLQAPGVGSSAAIDCAVRSFSEIGKFYHIGVEMHFPTDACKQKILMSPGTISRSFKGEAFYQAWPKDLVYTFELFSKHFMESPLPNVDENGKISAIGARTVILPRDFDGSPPERWQLRKRLGSFSDENVLRRIVKGTLSFAQQTFGGKDRETPLVYAAYSSLDVDPPRNSSYSCTCLTLASDIMSELKATPPSDILNLLRASWDLLDSQILPKADDDKDAVQYFKDMHHEISLFMDTVKNNPESAFETVRKIFQPLYIVSYDGAERLKPTVFQVGYAAEPSSLLRGNDELATSFEAWRKTLR